MSRAARKPTTRSAGKSPSITDLYRQFEEAHTAAQAVPEPKPPSLNSRAFERAIAKCGRIADRIVVAPSNSIDEMLLKIRVVGWCAGAPYSDRLSRLNEWKPGRLLRGEEFDALISLRADLRRLQATSTSARDDAVLALAEPFESACAAVRAADESGSNKDVEAACGRASTLAKRIAKQAARTLEGLKLKAAAIAYIHRGGAIKLTGNQTTDVRLAQSIIRDLLAI